ncbi:MAG: hypothetical protein WKF86_01760 [Acidimicrobiales bacterium]
MREDDAEAEPTRLAANRRLEDLRAMVDRLSDDPNIEHLPATLGQPGEDPRLEDVVAAQSSLAEGVRAGGAVAGALEQMSDRLAALDAVVDRLSRDTEVVARTVAPLPERLGAIAAQIDRAATSPPAPTGHEAGADGDADDRRLEAVVDVLAGVTRRQDEVATSIGAVLNQVRGPMGVDAVLDRMEQRERALAARLDRIDAELRRQSELAGSTSPVSEMGAAERLNSVVEGVVHVSRRQDELAAAIDRRLSAIEGAVNAIGSRDRQSASQSTSAEVAALRLAELRAERARVQAHLQEERLLAAQSFEDEYENDEVEDPAAD